MNDAGIEYQTVRRCRCGFRGGHCGRVRGGYHHCQRPTSLCDTLRTCFEQSSTHGYQFTVNCYQFTGNY